MLRHYRRELLRHDLQAGVALSALLIPAGMAYAQAAGLDPVYGLYAASVPLIAYAVFGPSRVLVLGPDSSLTPLIVAAVLPFASGDQRARIVMASALAILAGVMCVIGGVARLGFLTDLLSLPVRYGYLTGIALTVAVGQIPKLLGISGRSGSLFDTISDIDQGISHRSVRWESVTVGVAVLVLVLLMRRWKPTVPGVLLAVIGAIAASTAFALRQRGLIMVGDLPRHLPRPVWPALSLRDATDLVTAAFGVALVAFADTSLLSQSFARRSGSDVNPNDELVALGFANIASGLFQGFPVSASASRTPVAESSGARTQLTGIVAAVVIGAVLLGAPGVFRNLPVAALAGIVIAAAIGLVELGPMVRLARIRPTEMIQGAVAFAGVAIVGATRGVLVAVAVSLMTFFAKGWRPHITTLVRVDGFKGYHDIDRHPEGRLIPGLVLLRFDAPLFFANAGAFRREVLRLADPTKGVRRVIVTAEPITDIDSTATETLGDLVVELQHRDITFAFAELKGHVRETLDRAGLVEQIGRGRFYRTIGEAVKAYLAEESVEWVDWEDR
jgi:high affinity sulfate transporter 1